MIKKYDLRKVRLMEFAQVMANIKSFLEKENLADLELETLKAEFDKSFNAFEESLKPLRKSEHTEKLIELDNKRDILLVGYISHCKVFTNFPVKEKAEAAKKLVLINEKYGKSPQKQSFREETAIIRNLLDDLAPSEIKAMVTLIGAQKWIEHLAEANEAFATLHTDRTQEQGAVEVGKTKVTRSEMQATFSKLVTLINGLVVVKGVSAYQNLVNSINQEIKRVQ
ncbi:DUF6261 family protein [Capnocytophaga catalasegens]|uniref:Hemagglutinin n=1 Tax=Capnocytophaga catalasegens TaxID=1004260 RepID=A0AAV5AXF2_9FLAO|nr:DUF6261 family protein [Capnocytophaga catalasegens]GIZ14992.1 hypothetical protein RCZ03_09920 [Capnocytophaga catalasegens]GJM49372.1 hypothetical protein RCZ15_03470 [Capnocytophaga catalasegens]GJM52522.1 hypothetical protein RCZ16_08390 [Capnocytophaga catalasegens]